jgi:hypothetical protein
MYLGLDLDQDGDSKPCHHVYGDVDFPDGHGRGQPPTPVVSVRRAQNLAYFEAEIEGMDVY